MKSKLKIKGMSIMLVLAITMTSLIAGNLTANAAEDNAKIVLGDVNGDDKIDVADVTEVQKFIAGLVKFTDNQKKAANAFDDEIIDIADATEIQKYIAGYDVNENIGKTWHDAETERTWVFNKEPKLRYILINPNVCNTCNVPFIHNDGTDWNADEMECHHIETGHSGYRTQYDWYYIDENGHYHDLNDDGTVPSPDDKAVGNNDENVFDPDFDPYLTWVAIDKYNSTHANKFYITDEIWTYCNFCNSDGSCIFDKNGDMTNLKDGQCKLTIPKEFIGYPNEVADIDGYNKTYDDCTQILEKHKAEHKKHGDIPQYLGEAEVFIGNTARVYSVNNLNGHYEETVVKKSGWY